MTERQLRKVRCCCVMPSIATYYSLFPGLVGYLLCGAESKCVRPAARLTLNLARLCKGNTQFAGERGSDGTYRGT